MRLIDEINGDIWKLWNFWSVRFNVIAGACSATVAVYEVFKGQDPALIRWVPLWVMAMLAAGAVLFTFASIVARGIKQPEKCDQGGNS